MESNKIRIISLVFFLSLTLLSCINEPRISDFPGSTAGTTDYSKSGHWLSLPATINKEVDLFYLYPTAWQKAAGDSNICNIDNPSMLRLSNLALKRQATAFETIANIYAPFYRQVELSYYNALSQEDKIKVIGGIPTKDAIAAFDYYIKHYNNGRPFILAGHSQGSNVLINLLSKYMQDNPQVYSRMIAAYVIGYSVTNNYFFQNPHLKFANGPDDTGVIISYNTEAPTVSAPGNPVVLPGALVINPITWTRTGTLATADKNLGSILLNPDGTVAAGIPTPIMNIADAQIDLVKGVLVCSTVDANKWSPGNAVFGKGVYHSFDYPFYYYNIRENAVNRTNKFLDR